MKYKFTQFGIKTLLQLNIVSIVIIAFCEVFAVSVLFTKGLQPGIERLRFVSIIAGVVVITLLFIGSIVTFFFFLKLKNRGNP
jgi:hypothetical protein